MLAGCLKRVAGLKAIRDQAQTDAARAKAVLESAAQQPVTTTMLRKFAATARERMRIEGGGYRRDHLRALAQRVEVADREVRIMGSKGDLLRTLAAISGVKSATGGVRSSVLDWRRECQSTPVDVKAVFHSSTWEPTVLATNHWPIPCVRGAAALRGGFNRSPEAVIPIKSAFNPQLTLGGAPQQLSPRGTRWAS
jgi:hypothetical protein